MGSNAVPMGSRKRRESATVATRGVLKTEQVEDDLGENDLAAEPLGSHVTR